MNFAHYVGVLKAVYFFSSSYFCSERHFWLFGKRECFMRQKQATFLFGLDSEMFHVPFFFQNNVLLEMFRSKILRTIMTCQSTVTYRDIMTCHQSAGLPHHRHADRPTDHSRNTLARVKTQWMFVKHNHCHFHLCIFPYKVQRLKKNDPGWTWNQ